MRTQPFTQIDLRNFAAYEKVRASGRFNMLTPQARMAAGLTRDEHLFVIENYDALSAQEENDHVPA